MGLDLPLATIIGVAGRRRRNILTCTQIVKTTRAKA
jgi:hypothetical protein